MFVLAKKMDSLVLGVIRIGHTSRVQSLGECIIIICIRVKAVHFLRGLVHGDVFKMPLALVQ
jgi:hypothetical protein